MTSARKKGILGPYLIAYYKRNITLLRKSLRLIWDRIRRAAKKGFRLPIPILARLIADLIREAADKRAQHRLNDFKRIRPIDLEKEEKIDIPLKRYLRQIEYVNLLSKYFFRVVLSVAALLSAPVTLIMYVYVYCIIFPIGHVFPKELIEYPGLLSTILWENGLAIIIAWLIVLSYSLPLLALDSLLPEINLLEQKSRAFKYVSLLWLFVPLTLSSVIVFFYQEQGSSFFLPETIVSAFLHLAVFYVFILHTIIISVIPVSLIINLPSRVYPNASIINSVLGIMLLVDKKQNEWGDLAQKQEIVDELEDVARLFSRLNRQHIHCRDHDSDSWFKENTSQISAFFRSLKKWVLLSKQDTRTEFLSILSKNFVHLVRGEWDDLNKIEPAKVDVKVLWKNRIISVVKTLIILIIGFLPLVVLLVLNKDIITEGQVIKPSDFIVVAPVIWLLISILVSLDPLIREKLPVLESFFKILSSWRGKT